MMCASQVLYKFKLITASLLTGLSLKPLFQQQLHCCAQRSAVQLPNELFASESPN
jgi:hypothetical protein